MMLGARTAAWSGKRLPYLRRVAYLESSGTQRINTGYSPLSTSVFGVKFSILSSSYYTRWGLIYGAYGTDNPRIDCQLGFANDSNYLRIYNRFCVPTNSTPDYFQSSIGTIYDVVAKKGRMIVNGNFYCSRGFFNANLDFTAACGVLCRIEHKRGKNSFEAFAVNVRNNAFLRNTACELYILIFYDFFNIHAKETYAFGNIRKFLFVFIFSGNYCAVVSKFLLNMQNII